VDNPPGARRWSLLFVLLLGVALGAGGMWGAQRWRAPAVPPLNPQQRTLDADLYVQTAAEYRACCLQAYRLATERLRARAKGPGKPPAVVLDLDETVLDNSPFQTYLYRYNLAYSDPLWEDWEKNYPDEVLLVPGAKGFIEEAEKLGVTVIYVSNRLQKYRPATVAVLTRLGLNVKDLDRRLLLKEGNNSDKTDRRQRVERDHRVLLYVGDNLRDFSEEFVAPRIDKDDPAAQNKAIAARAAQVDRQQARWGDDWIILPNPVYGEWQRLLGGQPLGNLRPSSMKPPTAPAK
jgi:5'-nucleotidase (lipoprotein e(P4) family)